MNVNGKRKITRKATPTHTIDVYANADAFTQRMSKRWKEEKELQQQKATSTSSALFCCSVHSYLYKTPFLPFTLLPSAECYLADFRIDESKAEEETKTNDKALQIVYN